MDDPLWTWPAWKFGMKQEDLFTKLHDQYNTYTVPIQDTEAFYCDIAEISYEAQTPAEFHHLASHRRQRHLSELKKSLDCASFEIVGNPKLIEMPHWEHAVQLFQTNSLDSLVQYFASYLPTDHIWHAPCQDSAGATAHALTNSPLTKRLHKRSKTNEAVDAGRQTLVLSSSMVFGRLPAKDELPASDKALESTCLAALSSFSETAIKHTRPHEHSAYISQGVAALAAGEGRSTMSDFDTFTRTQCRIKNTPNETIQLEKRLSTKVSLKQVDLGRKYSEDQRERCVDSQVSAFPEILPSSPSDLSLSVSLRIPVESDGTFKVFNGVTTGLKRKR